MKFKFGDILDNGWATQPNPTKVGVLIRETARWFYMTDCDGEIWSTAQENNRMKKIGTVLAIEANETTTTKAPDSKRSEGVWSSVPRKDVEALEAKLYIHDLAKETGRDSFELRKLFIAKKIPAICIDGEWLGTKSEVLKYYSS